MFTKSLAPSFPKKHSENLAINDEPIIQNDRKWLQSFSFWRGTKPSFFLPFFLIIFSSFLKFSETENCFYLSLFYNNFSPYITGKYILTLDLYICFGVGSLPFSFWSFFIFKISLKGFEFYVWFSHTILYPFIRVFHLFIVRVYLFFYSLIFSNCIFFFFWVRTFSWDDYVIVFVW